MSKPGILIVEDEETMAFITKAMLEELGYTVTGFVSSGKEAVQETLATRPDLVLMDISLEGEIDGVETARQIQESIDIPIVYLTGYTDDDLLKRIKLTEPYGYIIKPFEAKDIHINIEIALYRHKMEKLLKESEKRYMAVSEMTSDYVYHIRVSNDSQLSVDWITEGFTRVTGYTLDDMRHPFRWENIIHPEDLSDVMEFLRKVIMGSSEMLECRVLSKKGVTLWMRVIGRPEWDGRRQSINGIIGAVSNITEAKRVENALTEAKERAEIANKTRSEFLAIMSHELRTPLNSVIGFSSLLLDRTCGEINERQKEYLNIINNSGNHLLVIVNDILDFAEAETGRMRVKVDKFYLPNLLDVIVTKVRQVCIKKNMEIEINVEEGLPVIEGDKDKLQKVMSILLDNAVKFTPHGGKITIEASRSNDDIQISVTDTGIGVKEEDRERIFNKFEQVDSTHMRGYNGVGMGLAFARNLIRLQGGEIWVANPPEKQEGGEAGKGSSFIFVIPCKNKRVVGQAINPETKLLTWDYFRRHLERILLFYKRINQSFGLLYLEFGSGNMRPDYPSLSNVFGKVLRRYEIFTQGEDKNSYYIALFGVNRSQAEDATGRIADALRERGYVTKTIAAIYPDDGESVEELLRKLNESQGTDTRTGIPLQ